MPTRCLAFRNECATLSTRTVWLSAHACLNQQPSEQHSDRTACGNLGFFLDSETVTSFLPVLTFFSTTFPPQPRPLLGRPLLRRGFHVLERDPTFDFLGVIRLVG